MVKRKDKQIFVKVVCVIASFILWLYIANVENPRQERSLKGVPVKLENVEVLSRQKLSLLPGQQELTVTLNLRGPASEVNKISESDFEVVADLSKYRYTKGQWPVPVEIRKRPNNIDIINDQSHVITLKFDDFAEKSVPVRADIEVEVQAGYMSSPPIPRPTSVHISGSAQYVNSVSYVLAKASQKGPVETNVEASVPLIAYDDAGRKINEEYVSIRPKVADVAVPVKKIKTVGVNVRTKGALVGDLVLKSLESTPDKIDIAGDANILNNISTLDTEQIDLSTISTSKSQDVKLVVPGNVTLINSNGTINVKINVDKIISKNFTVDIKYENLGANYNATLEKSKAVITIHGSENKVNTLAMDDIKCWVDLNNLGVIENQVVPISVRLPEGLTYESVNPKNIKVTITQKPAAPTSTTPANQGSGTSGEAPANR